MKIEQILLYDNFHRRDFYPFSLLHPVWELRAGTLKIFEKYQMLFPAANIVFSHTDDLILSSFLDRYEIKENKLKELNTIVFPANLIFSPECVKKIENRSVEFAILAKDVLSMSFGELMMHTPPVADCVMLNRLWDLPELNARLITDDFFYFTHYDMFKEEKFPGVIGKNEKYIRIGKNVKIEPFVYIDASEGPVIINDNAKIMSHSFIKGPAYIGRNSSIKGGAKIYHNSTIGDYCKVGGEIEATIFQGYSNKQHDGFLGHSFISEWVNLGAGTNNSDLKNNYSEVKLSYAELDNMITSKQFLGAFIGDHTKTAIGTRINTGTMCGICTNIFGDTIPPKAISSFSFGGYDDSPIAELDKTLQTCEKVMNRRNKKLSNLERELLVRKFNEKVVKM